MIKTKEIQRQVFCKLLRSTERKGTEHVLAELEKNGFFEAPAAAKKHLVMRVDW